MKKEISAIAILSVLFFAWIVPRGVAYDLPPAPAGTFSFVVLPDTQGYVTKKESSYLKSQVKWILDNRERQRIVFVSHVGDVVENYESEEEWKIATKYMLRLSGKLPFGISVGNHDMALNGDSRRFQQAFPARLFEESAWYGGQIKNNANSYQLISAEGMDFLILHLECNAPDDVLKWADGVLERHADRRAMITTHMYLGPHDRPYKLIDHFSAPKGRMRWHKTHEERGNSPEQMWQKCFRKHRSLFLVCCGDQSRTQAMHRTVGGDHGNPVHECLSDYRDGFLRVLRFEPDESRISVMTYSPRKKKLCDGTKIVPDVDRHQFVLEYAMGK